MNEENERRSPYGERGLKCEGRTDRHVSEGSLSLRRAWIEIFGKVTFGTKTAGRSPYGERGLKYGIRGSAHRTHGVALLTESVD